MSDIIDTASDVEETQRQAAINAARSGAFIRATGECLECGEELPDGLRFCSADCRNDWQAKDKARRNAGI